MNYYGQRDEDRWIAENLPLPLDGFFVDVGAGDGMRYSNTLFFEKQGWQGLCIDTDPRSYLKLLECRHFAFFSAIRKFEGVTNVFLNDEDPDLTRAIGTIGAGRTITVPCVPLGLLLQRLDLHRHIDLLSVDVEGLELEVLQSFNMTADYPTIIIVEYKTTGLKEEDQREELLTFFQLHPYQLVHQNRANFIFYHK